MEHRTKLINFLAEMINAKRYLEIGVRDSNQNFNLINIEHKDGVDPAPLNPVTYKMTSDTFFEKVNIESKYDIVFVDGLHTADQVYKDVVNSMTYLSEDGIIVMHDCNPPTEYHTRSYDEYLKTKGQWNGDVYKGYLKLRQDYPDWISLVMEEDFGCGIFTKNELLQEYYNSLFNIDVDKLTWEDFDKNKIKYLNLVKYNDLVK